MRRTLLSFFAGALVLGAAACSFTTGAGFNECATDVDCGPGMACVKAFCLPLPDGCRREAGVFNKADRIPLLSVQPRTLSTSDGGTTTDESEVQALHAMTLAVEEANTFGGLKGRPFGLFFCDTFDDNERGAAQAGWMVKNAGVPAIITSGSGLTTNVANQPDRLAAQTMIISNSSTSASLVALFRSDGNVWRLAPDDTQQAAVLAGEVAQATAGNVNLKVVILYVNSVYGTSFEPALRDELTRRGRLPAGVRFDENLDQTDAITRITEVENQSPVATVIVGFPKDVIALVSEGSRRAKLTRANGHRWFLADAAKDPVIITPVTRPELEASIGTAPAQGAGAAFGSFSDAFFTRFGVRPDTYSFTSHAYDAAWLTMGAAAWASQNGGGITGARMREGMARISQAGSPPLRLLASNWTELSTSLSSGTAVNVEGSSGALDYNLDAGTPSAPYEVWQVLDGGISTVRLVTP
ncbi:MAG: ABC transporter substrate-binding protein [Myxococcota bacterium]